jgi:CheY-like chemotaxis protein
MKSDPHRPWILVVDDDEAIRCALVEMLGSEGYIVEPASNGGEAITRLSSTSGSERCLVLLDLAMPVMNGWEVLEELSRRPPTGNVAVVTMSALGAPHGPTAIEAAGHLRKPLVLDELFTVIEQHCGTTRRSSAWSRLESTPIGRLRRSVPPRLLRGRSRNREIYRLARSCARLAARRRRALSDSPPITRH